MKRHPDLEPARPGQWAPARPIANVMTSRSAAKYSTSGSWDGRLRKPLLDDPESPTSSGRPCLTRRNAQLSSLKACTLPASPCSQVVQIQAPDRRWANGVVDAQTACPDILGHWSTRESQDVAPSSAWGHTGHRDRDTDRHLEPSTLGPVCDLSRRVSRET